MKRLLFPTFIVFTIFLNSCDADFSMDSVGEGAGSNVIFIMESLHIEETPQAFPILDIDEGTIVVSSIDFDGRRDQAGDYYFTRDFSTPVIAEMHSGVVNQSVYFDMPQGIYNRIDMGFFLGDESENALVLEGIFQRSSTEEVLVRYVYPVQEEIRVRAKNTEGSDQIVKTDNPIIVSVIVDVPYLFELVSMNLIQNAVTSQIEGEEVLLINNETNTDIFNLLATRFDNSTRVIFD